MPSGPQASPSLAKDTGILPGQQCFDESCHTVYPILPAFGDLFNGVTAAWRWLFPAARAAPTAAELIRPAGMDNAQFGKLIGWTRGGTLEENLVQTRQLIKDLPGRISQLRDAGVTRPMARQWAEFYQAEAERVLTNPNALPRSQLMQAIADLL